MGSLRTLRSDAFQSFTLKLPDRLVSTIDCDIYINGGAWIVCYKDVLTVGFHQDTLFNIDISAVPVLINYGLSRGYDVVIAKPTGGYTKSPIAFLIKNPEKWMKP